MCFEMTRRAALFGVAATPFFSVSQAYAKSEKGMEIERLDWAGIKINAGDVSLFVDASTPKNGGTLTSEARRTYALTTHPHGDHMSLDALKPVLGERGYLVAHKDAAPYIDQREMRVLLAGLYEPVFFTPASGDLVAWCVPAVDGFGSPQVSWIIDSGGKRVIHCGDTLWHGHWWNFARAFGPFDAAFLPINGARQIGGLIDDIGQTMTLAPDEAARAAKALDAKLAVPIHYGFHTDDYIETPNAEAVFLAEAKKLGVKTRVMTVGETYSL